MIKYQQIQKHLLPFHVKNNEIKEIGIKNSICYYFGDIIKIEDFDLHNILKDKKPYKNILVYKISHKSLLGYKPLRIGFDKIDGIIRVYDETRYLVLFVNEKYHSIYERIIYLISVKSDITYIISHNYAKVDLCESLPMKKTMTLCYVIILVIKIKIITAIIHC